MAEKELRRMNRAELIEIIYALQQNEKTLQKENEDLQRQLNDKLIRLEQAGSIAEAALSLNHVFEDAQEASRQYLESLASAGAQSEQILNDAKRQSEQILVDAWRQSEQIMTDTRGQAEDILEAARKQQRQTQTECEQLMAETNRKMKKRIDAVNQKIRETLNKYPELKECIIRERNAGGNGA